VARRRAKRSQKERMDGLCTSRMLLAIGLVSMRSRSSAEAALGEHLGAKLVESLVCYLSIKKLLSVMKFRTL
jgi:hypothetical protein